MTIISKYTSSIPPKYWLFFLIILALALRLFNLHHYGLWYDEAISYKAAQLDVASILTNQIQSSHPPLYYLLLHYWILIFPESDYAAKMLSVIWNIALIPVVFGLAKKIFKENKIALTTALLITISPFHIAYSQELRMYTQLMFFTTLAVLVYLYTIENDDFLLWTAFGVISFLAIYTHYFAALVLIGILIHEAIFRNNKKTFYKLLISYVVLFILYIPWVYVVLSQPDLSEGSLRPLFHGVNIQGSSLIIPFVNMSYLIFEETFNIFLFPINFYFSFLFFFLLFSNYTKLEKQTTVNGINLILVVAMVCIIVPSIFYYLFSMFFPHRTIAAASPFLLILLGCFITSRKKLLSFLVYIFILLSCIGTIYYYTESNHNRFKIPNREVAHLLEKNWLHYDTILHTDDFSYIPLLRYLNLPNHARLSGSPRQLRADSAYEPIGGQLWDIDVLENKNGRLWLIVAALRAPEWQREQKEYLLQQYNLIDKYYISGYEVYLLDIDEP